MSTIVVRSIGTGVARVDMKFEVVVIPVSDVDRAMQFYGTLGWRLDPDFRFDNGFRVVQLTPPGSGCSVQFGTNITSALPGSAQGLYRALRRAEAADGDHEKRTGAADPNWPDWYAAYMVGEQAGTELPK